MIINGNNSRSNNIHFVRTSPAKQATHSSFGETLSKTASQRDAFSSSSVAGTSGTAFDKAAFSSVSETQAKLDNISAAIKDTDYSGMTKSEIYADIEKKYEDAFDDFHMTMAIWPSEDHRIIHTQFLEDVWDNMGSMYIPIDFVHEARGYSNMTYDEIEASIKEKYVGKTGFVDQLNLLGELFSSGVLDNKYGGDEAFRMICHLNISLECGGDRQIPKNEWLERIEQTGASSPFAILLNYPYFEEFKELYKTMIDDILFGIAD